MHSAHLRKMDLSSLFREMSIGLLGGYQAAAMSASLMSKLAETF